MNLFKRKIKKSVPDKELYEWLWKRLDSNLLRWGGYRSREEYEHEMSHPYNKETFIKENRADLERAYVIRQHPEFQGMKKGGKIAEKKETEYTIGGL